MLVQVVDNSPVKSELAWQLNPQQFDHINIRRKMGNSKIYQQRIYLPI